MGDRGAAVGGARAAGEAAEDPAAKARDGAPSPSGRGFSAFLLLTSLVCGALVMTIEVMGSRVIGPYYGVSLFVWTSLITVTMVGLAAGYAFGGWLADRRPHPDWLYALILAAGLCALPVPHVKEAVLRGTAGLGLRAGAFTSALVLFGPSLFLLGCVSPYIVRIATRELARVGRTVGLLSALSTVGSVLGTILTGFVLVAHLGVPTVFRVVGGALVAIAVAYALLYRRAGTALLALAVVAIPSPDRPLGSKVLPGGTTVRELEVRETRYAEVRVVEYAYGADATREMIVNGQIQGGLHLPSDTSVYSFAYALERLPVALHPAGRRCLVVGLGAALVPRWYEARGIVTDVVDIDPEIVELARRHFRYEPRGRVVVDDARHFVNTTAERYDYVVVDVFAGDTSPGHVLTLEAARSFARVLTPGGVLALNVIGPIGTRGTVPASIARTLERVFDVVEVRPLFAAPDTWGNLAIVAYRGAPREPARALFDGEPVYGPSAAEVARIWEPYAFPAGTPSLVLTDDHEPTDVMDLDFKEELRRWMNRGRPEWDLAG